MPAVTAPSSDRKIAGCPSGNSESAMPTMSQSVAMG